MLPLLIWSDNFKPATRLSPEPRTTDLDVKPYRFRTENTTKLDLGRRIRRLEAWARKTKPPHIRVSWSRESGNTVVEVPAGFVSDGASIPLLAQLVMGDRRLYKLAGIIHDALYRDLCPRALADEVFWIIARSGRQGVPRTRAFLGWAGLRLGGWWAYSGWKRRAEVMT